MRYASVCSGVEAASLAWMPLGWEAVWFSEIEPFPCAVLKERFPDVPNLGDMTEIKGDKYHGTVDLLVGGTPCFVAGTMVLTPCGYKPIESLKIGDSVVTHTGDVRSITAIGSKEAQTGKVKILGRPSIRCTGNHPFYSIELKRDNKRNSSTYGPKVEYGEYEFKAVEDSVGRYAGRVTAKRIDGHIPNVYNATPEEIVELAGWYIGDGYIRRWNGKNKKAVIIAAVCKRKIDQFSKTFNGAIQYSVAKDGKITITNTVLADWLIENFGEKSQSKKLPYWIYTSELKNRFIAGYEKTHGSRRANGNVRISTTSAALAYGMADLYGNASVEFCKRETPHVIMGRKVSQRDTYTIYKAKGKTARTKMLCGRYASIIRGWNNDGAIRTVYNITVDGEHSYIVNGIAVHNCQGFSVAGKQGGLNDSRSALCLAYCNLLETMRPRWFVWENVPGVFSTNGGEDFRAFLRKIDEIGYSCAWRVLDAQFVRVDGFPRAVPQRRRRVFVVGHLGGDWRYPASVLFEPGCLPGDTPPRRIKGEGVAADAKGSIDTAKSIRMRCGKPGGGKGALIGDDLSHTLATGNDQTVVYTVHGAQTPISNDDHANALGCSNSGLENCVCVSKQKKPEGRFWNGEDVAGTLTVTSDRQLMPDKGRLQCVIEPPGKSVECLDTRQVDSHDTDLSPTLIATDYKGGKAVCYENHAQDSRIKPVEVSQSIVARMGTGGNNLPLVQAVAVAENIIGRKENTGANGTGAQVELAYTQNATGVMGVSVNTSVRRLLPVECERLMGFPEVDILEIGKMTKDEFIAWELASGNITVDFSTGKVFSCRTGGGTPCPPHELEGTILSGYKVVSLREKEVKKQCRVHRILWIAAHGIIPDGYVIDHINNDKLDNRLCNLQLLRPEENSTKAAKDGLYLTGEDHPKTKLTDEQKNDIITLYETEYYSVRRLAAMYGVSKSRIHQLVKRQGWTQIPWKGKPAEDCPDSPRYKACGNSMCVNVMRWIGMRIENLERRMKGNKNEQT